MAPPATTPGSTTTPGPGRPRLKAPTRPGASAREEILDAAAELFTTRGFATTSTRAIADAVGIRQASLYHHFATKDDLLAEMLGGTVGGPLRFGRALLADLAARSGDAPDGPADDHPDPAAPAPVAHLHALAAYDGTQLCAHRWNLGILYHLPEARGERFRPFLEDRAALRGIYRDLGRAVDAGPVGAPAVADVGELTFRLVESLINLRADGGADARSPLDVADACLRLAAPGADVARVRADSDRLVRALVPDALVE